MTSAPSRMPLVELVEGAVAPIVPRGHQLVRMTVSGDADEVVSLEVRLTNGNRARHVSGGSEPLLVLNGTRSPTR